MEPEQPEQPEQWPNGRPAEAEPQSVGTDSPPETTPNSSPTAYEEIASPMAPEGGSASPSTPFVGYPAFPEYPAYPVSPGSSWGGYPSAPVPQAPLPTTGEQQTGQAGQLGQSAPPSYPFAPYPYAGYPPYPMYPPMAAPPSGAQTSMPSPLPTPESGAQSTPAAPYPPYGYPAFPSYPLYPGYSLPSAPAGYAGPSPFPSAPIAQPSRQRKLVLPITIGAVAAILLIALVGVALANSAHLTSTLGGGASSSNATDTPIPTSTSLPTATAFPGSVVYSNIIPGVCGDTPNNWATDDGGTQATCSSTALTLTNPATDKTVSEEFFQPPNYTFPARYEVSATISNLANACAGISVVRDNYQGYGAYICDDSNWVVEEYDKTGQPSNVSYGGFIRAQTYQMSVGVTSGQLTLTLNGDVLFTWPPTLTVTIFVGLQVYPRTNGTQASADFDHFSLTA